MKKKPVIPVPILEMALLSKTKCNICIAYNCTIPKKCPQWLLDLWINREKMWFEIEISFTEILELFNLGMDVMLSRNGETGNINISLNELGWRFHQR